MTDFSPEAVDTAIRARRDPLPFQLQSDHIDKISAALSKAQAEMTNAVYNRENPHFQSKYADLAAVRHATMTCLTNNGISLSQQSTFVGEHLQFVLITQLSLGDQFLRDIQPLPVSLDKPQTMVSFRSYARRAGWSSICGIAVEGEDDDGNRATATKLITNSQLDELMKIAEGIDMGIALPWLADRLKYPVENLSMVKRADMGRVKAWLQSARKEKKK